MVTKPQSNDYYSKQRLLLKPITAIIGDFVSLFYSVVPVGTLVVVGNLSGLVVVKG